MPASVRHFAYLLRKHFTEHVYPILKFFQSVKPCLNACIKLRPNVQTLPDEHFEFCLSSKLVRLVTTNEFCMSMKLFKNIYCLSQANYVCVMAKLINIVLARQNFKCLPNNDGSFGRSFSSINKTTMLVSRKLAIFRCRTLCLPIKLRDFKELVIKCLSFVVFLRKIY